MNKRQIIILIIVGLVIFIATFLGVYFLSTNDDNKPAPKEEAKNIVKLKDYILEYGTYVGEEKEYDPDTEQIKTKQVKIILTKDTIGDQKYTIKDNSLYVKGSNNSDVEMYEAKKNNEFSLLAGSGVDFKLKK